MQKLIHNQDFAISEVGTEVAPIFSLSQSAGWNQTINDLKTLVAQPGTINLQAILSNENQHESLGCGMVVRTGESVGWIGMVLVDPARRRQGIAGAVMENCLELARVSSNLQIIGLDATPQGMMLYQRIGFIPSYRLWRCRLNTQVSPPSSRPFQIEVASPFELCTSLLSRLSMKQFQIRLKLINQMNPKGLWLARSGEGIVGMLMSRPGQKLPFIGPLIAESKDIAKQLLISGLNYWKERGFEEIFMDIPESHLKDRRTFLGQELNPERELTRMYEVLTDDLFQILLKRNGKFYRTPVALEKGRSCASTTLSFMKLEKELIPYTFASGGPEVG